MTFLIDTGADVTIIGAQDATSIVSSFHLPAASFSVSTSTVQVFGGGLQHLHRLAVPVTLYFPRFHITPSGGVPTAPYAFQFSDLDMYPPNTGSTVPSVLGRDFLYGNQFGLVFDPPRRLHLLDTQEMQHHYNVP